MALEASVQRNVWIKLARRAVARVTLFRSNSGKAWLSGGPPAVIDQNRTAHVPMARPVGLGLCLLNGDSVSGQGDLTGYTEVTITPAMVGKVLPVFTMIETKRSKGGRKAQNQVDCLEQVQRVGGIAGFAASDDEANNIIDAWLVGHGLSGP